MCNFGKIHNTTLGILHSRMSYLFCDWRSKSLRHRLYYGFGDNYIENSVLKSVIIIAAPWWVMFPNPFWGGLYHVPWGFQWCYNNYAHDDTNSILVEANNEHRC